MTFWDDADIIEAKTFIEIYLQGHYPQLTKSELIRLRTAFVDGFSAGLSEGKSNKPVSRRELVEILKEQIALNPSFEELRTYFLRFGRPLGQLVGVLRHNPRQVSIHPDTYIEICRTLLAKPDCYYTFVGTKLEEWDRKHSQELMAVAVSKPKDYQEALVRRQRFLDGILNTT